VGLFDRFIKKTDEYYIVKACYLGDLDYVRNYISSGKNINVVYKRETPLISAVEQNQVEVVKLLLENGADTSLRSIKSQPALHCAVYTAVYETYGTKDKNREPPTEILQLLLDYGADFKEKCMQLGVTPLEFAKQLITAADCAPQNVIDILEKYTHK